MVAPIPPMLKYSIVYNLLNFPPILIKFVSKFIVCKVLYFKAQYLLRLRSPLSKCFLGRNTSPKVILAAVLTSVSNRYQKKNKKTLNCISWLNVKVTKMCLVKGNTLKVCNKNILYVKVLQALHHVPLLHLHQASAINGQK